MKIVGIITLSVLFILTGCSTSQQIEKKEEEKKVYVFDEVKEPLIDSSNIVKNEEIAKEEKPIIKPKEEVKPEIVVKSYWTIQVGAFSSKKNAENFIKSSGSIKKLLTNFNKDSGLWVVQVDKKFENKKEAERLKNELLKNDEFEDAFLVFIQ